MWIRSRKALQLCPRLMSRTNESVDKLLIPVKITVNIKVESAKPKIIPIIRFNSIMHEPIHKTNGLVLLPADLLGAVAHLTPGLQDV